MAWKSLEGSAGAGSGSGAGGSAAGALLPPPAEAADACLPGWFNSALLVDAAGSRYLRVGASSFEPTHPIVCGLRVHLPTARRQLYCAVPSQPVPLPLAFCTDQTIKEVSQWRSKQEQVEQWAV